MFYIFRLSYCPCLLPFSMLCLSFLFPKCVNPVYHMAASSCERFTPASTFCLCMLLFLVNATCHLTLVAVVVCLADFEGSAGRGPAAIPLSCCRLSKEPAAFTNCGCIWMKDFESLIKGLCRFRRESATVVKW